MALGLPGGELPLLDLGVLFLDLCLVDEIRLLLLDCVCVSGLVDVLLLRVQIGGRWLLTLSTPRAVREVLGAYAEALAGLLGL